MNVCIGWPAILSATADEWIAAGTWVLAIGVIVALFAYLAQQRATRLTEATNLLRLWRDAGVEEFLAAVDTGPDAVAARKRANELYNDPERRPLFAEFIQNLARLADWIEVYIRNKVAEERIVPALLCYDVVAVYFMVEDILGQRTEDEGYDYTGFRNFAFRIQDCSRIWPHEVQLLDELKWAKLLVLKHYDYFVSGSEVSYTTTSMLVR